ncbi:hypothetical protein [Enterococcus casseliflavus]|uniref:hypothetical protein n=1 Tax=Enterococcus casseliflavus TaxID=37734 RepID=UPI003D6BF7A2
MGCKFSFIIGAYMTFGMIDVLGGQSVNAAIYNPLDPSEEITPKDHSEESQEQSSVHETKPIEEAEKERNEVNNEYQQDDIPPVAIEEAQFIEKKRVRRVWIEQIFLTEELQLDLSMPGDNGGGDDDDTPSFISDLCYLYSGSILYGQNIVEGVKTYVYDLFE